MEERDKIHYHTTVLKKKLMKASMLPLQIQTFDVFQYWEQRYSNIIILSCPPVCR